MKPDLKIETDSKTWHSVTAWLNHEIGRLREQNDSNKDIVETSVIRGEIKAFKKLLSLPKSIVKKGEREKQARPRFTGNGDFVQWEWET